MLRAEKIYKSFGETEVLHGVDLAVETGEFLSIMGESGSGKSTLLGILGGNIRPDLGSVLLDGQDVCGLNERELAKMRRTKLGFVYQSLNLISTLRGDENVLLPLYLDKADVRKGKERMTELAELMGISHVLESFPEQMSGGERQRVAIARALIHDPAVVMLDEPTGSLDSVSTAQVLALLKKINRDMGVSIIQVTHSADAASYGDRTVYLNDGRIAKK